MSQPKNNNKNLKTEIIPLKERKIDIALLFFYWINILFITYIIDIEQNIIKDPSNFDYPLWPPKFAVDIIHWYGYNYDPVLIARPMWWKMTIWIDSIFFGPFYILAIYAYTKGKEWIRVPSFLWASSIMTNVLIILGEEIWGEYPTPKLGIVLLLNFPWLFFPGLTIYRMWKAEEGRAFCREQEEETPA
ncbi:MAG: DUF2781 domain-containing protein [Candidatus Heimdallarchaeota archaeon]|nr:DUF2781 domain-containing protein [Candidatus Heimdallarchaeota archaeon]MDH5645627.1 DUF2781 domain-containing protein [Candidatus Heimdallarchaeota archaeon]